VTWHVWTDGSCQHGLREAPRGLGGWGGWCAIVENGSDGRVVRGRVPDTTNVRMELRAAIEGLRTVADGEPTVLHTDCTTVMIAVDRWQRGLRPNGKDAKLWLELGQELDRVPVTTVLIVRGVRDPIHRRCHTIAGAEARGGLSDLPANSVPLDEIGGAHKIRKGMRRLAVREVPNVTCDLCGSVGGHRQWCHRYRPFAQTSPSHP
jgi:ribonuclease HI